MIDPSSDAKQLPFSIDGILNPAARSALAILSTEAAEVDHRGAGAVLADALELHDRDAELTTVYGRRVAREELKDAAAALEDPERRVLAELLDFPSYDIELDDLSDLAQALDDHAQSFTTTPELENLDLMARLLDAVVGEPELPQAPPLDVAPPALPVLKDIIDGLA
ncbi:MAG: hypothetical protein V3W41_21415 [Planctomycetota bacterium]